MITYNLSARDAHFEWRKRRSATRHWYHACFPRKLDFYLAEDPDVRILSIRSWREYKINGKPGVQYVWLMDSSLYDAISTFTSRFCWTWSLCFVESFHSWKSVEQEIYGCFQKRGIPKWTIKIDDLGVPLFLETPISEWQSDKPNFPLGHHRNQVAKQKPQRFQVSGWTVGPPKLGTWG